MLQKDEILQFIDTDKASEKKKFARVGQRYYEGNHDIKDYELYYYNADGELVKDKTRSNIKISHPFFTEIVDQSTQYMLSGKDGFVKSDLPELQTHLDAYFNENEDFMAELYEVITGSQSKGFEYMYAYMKEDGTTAFSCADSLGVVEVEGRFASDKTDHVIYWYVDRVDKDGKRIKKVQVWDADEVYYYSQIDEGELLDDTEAEINPRPHIVKVNDKGQKLNGGGYGTIPFFRLDNCKKQFSALKPIKPLIDDYDLMACGLSNNIQDASEYLVVVKGFQGDNIEELMQNVKTKKHIGVDGDDGGDVEYKTVDIPYQARQVKLELDEKNIYRFGMGFNSAQMGDGNITNIVIKSRYALLDMKCTKLEIRLKQFLRKILKVVIVEINDKNGTDYQMKDVYFNFKREVMTNAQDNATIEYTEAQTKQILVNTLLAIAQQLGDELLMQNLCDVLDIDYEQIKGKLPVPEEQDTLTAQDALNGVVTDEQTTETSATITTE